MANLFTTYWKYGQLWGGQNCRYGPATFHCDINSIILRWIFTTTMRETEMQLQAQCKRNYETYRLPFFLLLSNFPFLYASTSIVISCLFLYSFVAGRFVPNCVFCFRFPFLCVWHAYAWNNCKCKCKELTLNAFPSVLFNSAAASKRRGSVFSSCLMSSSSYSSEVNAYTLFCKSHLAFFLHWSAVC